MIMNAVISKWGHSAAVRIPKPILDDLNIVVGEQVDIRREGDSLVISKPEKSSLASLLSQVSDDNRHQEYFSDQQGKELI
jgi:antitoxin MazE